MKLYNKFIKSLNEKQLNNLKLLIFWPLYGLAFLILERVLPLEFNAIACKTDNFIPFNEYFIIAYYMWFVFLVGMQIYTFFKEPEAFKKSMWFIIITYTVTVLIYVIYPSCQELRPTSFERDNVFTKIVSFLYSFDTNTNTCPSIHILGMVGVLYGGFNTKKFGTPVWKIMLIISFLLIGASTVFLKQHSIIDVYVALLLSILTLIPLHIYYKK